MAYATARAVRPPTPRERRRGEVLKHADAHLLEANLTARRIASDLGISARCVQIIFASMGTTPSAYIQSRRLDHAAAQLVQARRAAPITEIAFDSGFNDLSTFCRLFRRKFGVAPRDYRAGARRVVA
jgi:AraC family transcriptional regulator, positive regulator of tynA and feaB